MKDAGTTGEVVIEVETEEVVKEEVVKEEATEEEEKIGDKGVKGERYKV